jgi:hypothetical protein
MAGNFYEIVDFKRTCNEKQNAARDIAESSVDGEADADAGGSDKCGERARINAEVADEADDDEALRENLAGVNENSTYRGVEFAALFDFSANALR